MQETGNPAVTPLGGKTAGDGTQPKVVPADGGSENPQGTENKGGDAEKQNPQESRDLSIEFLRSVSIESVLKEITKRGGKDVSTLIQSLRVVTLTRGDGSQYRKIAVSLKSSVAGMVNAGTAAAPQWVMGWTRQVWLFPNQILRAAEEGGLDVTDSSLLQSMLGMDLVLNQMLAGAMLQVAIEPVVGGDRYVSPWTGEDAGEVKNTSFYYTPVKITLSKRNKENIQRYANTLMTQVALNAASHMNGDYAAMEQQPLTPQP